MVNNCQIFLICQVVTGLAFMFCQPSTAFSQREAIVDSVVLNTVVVTSQFLPTDSEEVVASVRVISEDKLDRQASVNLLEVLQAEPNIRLTYDPILGTSLSMNGLPAENVQILMDGVPVVGRLNGAIDVSQLPVGNVRQVEIIEGAQSLIYGSSAAAGVINMLTRSSQVQKTEAEVRTQYEPNGFRNFDGHLGLRMGDFNVGTFGGLSYFRPQGVGGTRDQVWNPKDQYFGRLLLGYMPHEGLRLRASGNYFDETVTNKGEVRRPEYKPYAFDDYYFTRRTDANIQGEGWIKDDYYVQGVAAYNTFRRSRETLRTNFEDGSEELQDGTQDTSYSDGILVRASVASDYDKAWNFLVGTDYNRETLEDDRILDEETKVSGFAAADQWGVYGSGKLDVLQSLVLQAGARLTNHSNYGAALTPSVWLKWSNQQHLTAKLSYANGFRSPNLKELYFEFIDVNHFIIGNPDLMPERSHNLLAELEYANLEFGNFSATLRLNGFYNAITDRIVLAEFEPLEFTYQNLDLWRTAGSGITVKLIQDRIFELQSAFIGTGFFNSLSSQPDVPDMSFSPEWSNNLDGHFWKNRITLSLWHKWTGATPFFYLDETEIAQGERAGWHLLNASVTTAVWQGRVRISTGVKNILDQRDVAVDGGNGGVHGSASDVRPVHWGRSFFISAAFQFKSKL